MIIEWLTEIRLESTNTSKKTFRKPSLCSKSKNIQLPDQPKSNTTYEDMALAMLGLLTPSFTLPNCASTTVNCAFYCI